jgi:methionyl-tRNA formyltransferase
MRINKSRKFKVTFLLDKTNIWIEKYLLNFNFNLEKKFRFKIVKNFKYIKNEDIVIILSYTKILPENFLNKNRLNIVIHASKLPKDRGFAPVQYQVLRGKNIINICLLEAVKEVDAGDIFLKSKFKLKKTDLSKEIRDKQAQATLMITREFLEKYPKVKKIKQKGKASFNKRRYYDSNKLDINKSIKKQFNILRISDNKNYPAHFNIYNTDYILHIYKKKN